MLAPNAIYQILLKMRAIKSNSNKGQSVIETTFLLGFFVVSVLFTLKLALKFILILSVDDFLESYLLCNAYQSNAYCRADLDRKMRRAHIRLDSVELIEHPDKTIAHLQMSNGLFKTVRRSREYQKR